MSDIVIGDSVWQDEAGTNTEGGWNSAGSIWGSADNDTFTFADQSWIAKAAGSSAWSIDGGAGVNTVSVANATSGVSILLDTHPITNIQLLEGSNLGDKLGGSSVNETLAGGGGADSIWGAGGSDILTGGVGADAYWFGIGDGADTITDESSNNKSDAVVFYSSSFSQLGFSRVNGDADLQISVNVDQGYTDVLLLENVGSYMDSNSADRINSFFASDITFGLSLGTASDDNLLGSSIADYMVGGAGDDTLDGGLGGDAIYGDAGDDVITYSAAAAWLDGGEGTNSLTAESSAAAVSFNLSNSSSITNFSILVGSNFADLIGGSASEETIQGGTGADSLWGGAGEIADLLSGGTGADSYWFGAGDGADTIASETTNYVDTVMFYGDGIGGGGIASTTLNGYNLTIAMTSGGSLTLLDWQRGDSYKVNNFDFGSAGVYQLSVASDNTPTWTLKSS